MPETWNLIRKSSNLEMQAGKCIHTCSSLWRARRVLEQSTSSLCSYAALPETSTPEKAIEGVSASSEEHSHEHKSRFFPGAAINQFGRDLTDQARKGLLDPVIGRENVIQRALQVILRRAKNNPCLIGDAGVGKTAIVEGIAQLMVSPQVPPGLAGKRLIALDVTSLVAGSAYRGEFESRLRGLLKDVADARGGVILFVDEMHMLMGAGASEGGLDASNILKPALARGGLLQCIGATTVEEWRQHIEPDAAFMRRWQPIMVQEPSLEAAYACLQGLRPRYEAHHSVVITDAALKAAVRCAKRHITDRRLPDSAIDIIDESAARCLLRSSMETAQASDARAAHAETTTAACVSTACSSQSTLLASPQITPPAPGTHANASLTYVHTVQSPHSSSQVPPISVMSSHRGYEMGCHSPVTSPGSSGSMCTSRSCGDINGHGNSTDLAGHVATHNRDTTQPSPSGASLTDWQTWLASRGLRGQMEHERQQLLEWFGATPDNPEPGSEGHRQTATKRSLVRQASGGPQVVFGAGLVPPAGAASTREPHARAGDAGSPFFSFAANIPVGVRRLEVAPQTFSRSKPCPQCGYLCDVKDAKLSEDGLRLRCPSCTSHFLNIPPEKLLLGTSTFQVDPPPHYLSSKFAVPAVASYSRHAWELPNTPIASNAQQHQGQSMVEIKEPHLNSQQQQQDHLAQELDRVGLAPITPQLQQLQQERRRQQETAEAFARPFPIHCVVDEQDVLEAVTEATGIPVTAMDSQSTLQLMNIEQALSKAVLGQEAAVKAVCQAVRLWRMGMLQSDHRPAASFVFKGPRGVGKSLMCKELALQIMGDEQALLQLQMSEYSDRASLARLLGAPPGYVGYGRASGTLVDAVRRRPHSVLVLEDIDRAHPEVQEVLLRVVDKGSLSDTQGRRASFDSAFVIFTLSHHFSTPAQSRQQGQQQQQQQQSEHQQQSDQQQEASLGRGAASNEHQQQAGALAHSSSSDNRDKDDISSSRPSSASLPPAVAQLLSLVDAVVTFGPLNRGHLAHVVEAQLADVVGQVTSRTTGGIMEGSSAGVTLQLDDAARAFLVEVVECSRAGGPGAQHVRSLIRTHVMGPLADQLLLVQAQQQQALLGGVFGRGSAGSSGNVSGGEAASRIDSSASQDDGMCVRGTSATLVIKVSYERPAGSIGDEDGQVGISSGQSRPGGRLVFQAVQA